MATIYCLQTDGFIWYVGSTTNLAKRKYNHKARYNKGIGSDLIPSLYDWTLKVLEKCSVADRYLREQHYFDTLHPLLNQQRPGQTRREAERARYHRDPDKARENARKKYYANLEHNRERYRFAAQRRRAEKNINSIQNVNLAPC